MTIETDEVLAIANQIKPLLAGRGAAVQGAVLAELTSVWLKGHHHEEGEKETRELRKDLLRMHVSAVWQLTNIEPAKEQQQ